jgi:cell division protein FtsI (penicillin-binding protein 3)
MATKFNDPHAAAAAAAPPPPPSDLSAQRGLHAHDTPRGRNPYRQRQRSRYPQGPQAIGLLPTKAFRPRFLLVVLLLILTGLALVYQLFSLQVVRAKDLSQKAEDHWQNARILKTRGRLLDRNGLVLAQDRVVYDLYVHPQYLKGQTPHEIAVALSPYLKQPVPTLEALLNKQYDTITLARDVKKSTKEAIDKLRLAVPLLDEKHDNQPVIGKDGQPIINKVAVNGLDWFRKTQRLYPQGRMASHLLGFFNDEAKIASGVEHTGKALMTGQFNSTTGGQVGPVLLDAHAKPLDFSPEALRQVIEGNPSQDVALTIDARLQFIAEKALREGVAANSALRGMTVVLNPKNGEILAFAVMPDFDPAHYSKEKDFSHLKNWALTDGYPPGSTMKILTVAFGLESGIITPASRILDTGRMTVGGWPLANYDVNKRPYPGNIDLVYLFTHSSNIASAKIALGIPKAKYERMLRRAGFGSLTGIDLPAESAGLVHPSYQWDKSTQATLGFGYGVIATPIQLASAVASLADKGLWHAPHVIADAGHVAKLPPDRRVFSATTAQAVTDLLSKSIAQSKTHPANLAFTSVAGKTGTSRKPSESGAYGNDLYTSFVGYFPAQAPELVIMVLIDSPHRSEAWGSTVAAPIFRKIATEAAHLYGISNNRMAKTVTAKDNSLAVHGRDG